MLEETDRLRNRARVAWFLTDSDTGRGKDYRVPGLASTPQIAPDERAQAAEHLTRVAPTEVFNQLQGEGPLFLPAVDRDRNDVVVLIGRWSHGPDDEGWCDGFRQAAALGR